MRRLLAVLAVFLVSSCGVGVQDVPLPGGADVGSDPYRVTARFADVLDLVPQASVKVNDVAVGRVESVRLAPDGWTAEVTLLVHGDVRLARDAEAELKQSSLLGEKYVQLVQPERPAPEALADGAVIPLERTGRNPQVEEVLGALSMLLNGGIGQVHDVIEEVNAALSGNEGDLRALLSNVDTFVGTLDAQKADITRAIDGLNRLSASLAGQRDDIVTALDGIGPGLAVIAEQRGELVTMLQSVDRLSAVAVDAVHRSRDDILADLHALVPTLRALGDAGANLPRSLEVLLTPPFTDYSTQAIRGDYMNADIQLDLELGSVLGNLAESRTPIVELPDHPPPLPLPAPPPQPVPPALPAPLGGLLDGLLGGL